MKLPPRVPLAHLPTPLMPLPRLSAQLGVQLEVKRDDLTGSHLSGNKVRKLEYLLAEAQAQGATHIVTCGGVQSNHCRATALAAASLGLKSALLLRTPNGRRRELPEPPRGNVLLDLLAGAELHACSPSGYEARDSIMADIAAEIGNFDGHAYIIPEGGSNALGALGYVDAAREIIAQSDESPPDAVVCATGSGGTVAGLALGFRALGVPTKAVGIAVGEGADTFTARIDAIAEEAAARFGLDTLEPGDFEIIDGFQGRGYALTTEEELAFLIEVARRDGLVLDPVYTNKALRALTLLLTEAPRRFGERVVFLHTGGIFGLMAQAEELAPLLRER